MPDTDPNRPPDAVAPRTPRERARAEFTADLLAAARARVRDEGAAQLSLRAVARDLGVASSAVYRYVDSRDALLTLLIIEAYDAAGTACEEAAERGRRAGAAPAQTWLAVARAFRAWALADRHGFGLVYGTPVPGYLAPQDTVRPATRVWGALGGVVAAAMADGSLRPGGPDVAARDLVEPQVLEFAAGIGAGAAAPGGSDALESAAGGVVGSEVLFAALLGAVSMELYGHLHNVMTDTARVFDVAMATAAAGVGLHVSLDGPVP
ncbi:TetR/AcrR family transcriptional regulator [Cellulomonas rhizosphaerae]|uniref:TetR family transcriptional regulator n=1 Tax=Cellulomonas rhizosphaerae TaxID=2293719 RepID=A0A413RRK3_9CELL|nr:TetR-like C-terminal domain-containing protein [Cellulomonas rhizosphaerae]RHA44531.1 TetR family transcriptional regulator [Cellulomonas rhizosphaerae]